MASNPKIEVEVTLDATKLKKGAADAEKAVGGLGGALGNAAKDKLGPMGDALDKVGVSMEDVGTSGLVAAAGVAAVGKFVADGVTKINQMTDEVRKFKAASGESWESASKFVAVADDLGVSADQVAAGVNKLAKAAAGGELEKFGIEAVRANDGTIDMGKTLAVVADAMNNEHDQAKKAAMGTALLGKSWIELNPLLEQGSAGINDAMKGVKDYQIVTEESAAQQREMSLAVDDLQDAISGLQMAMAKDLIPSLTKMASAGAQTVDTVNKLTSAVGGMDNILASLPGVLNLQKGWGMINDALGTGKKKTDDATASVKAQAEAMGAAALKGAAVGAANQLAADAAEELAKSDRELAAEAKAATAALKAQEETVAKLRDTVYSVVDAQLAYDASVTSLNNSTDELTQKHNVLTEALAVYGEGSDEAWKATKDYQTGLHDAEQAAVSNAQATKAMAEQQAIAAGVAMTAEQSNIVYRNALVAVRDAATDPGLVDGLNGLIGLVDSTAAAAGNAQQQLDAAAAAASRLAAAAAGVNVAATTADAAESILSRQAAPARASGGPVSAGQPYTVGEQGTELFVPQQSGTIVPNDKLGGGGDTYNFTINGAVGNQDDLMRYIHDGLRRLERSKR